ncbi:MAG TPA: NAD-dependent epimerase/dehydratase family protein [Longimicrobium sp.]|nr:NAD-dependent epimerase/dehydratase family protein [Longimicrobium sp.]
MKLLVLGGTRFVGRFMVEAALERGHRVTLFNRGKTDPEGVPGAEHLTGDRTEGLDALAGRTWDAVIDSSGYAAKHVRASAGALAGAVGRYVFVSTISVYSDFARPGMDEDGPVFDPDFESLDRAGDRYGPMKVACERVVEGVYGDRALVVRPGIVAGPDDYTDRLPYWVRRIAAGGEVLAPGRPHAPVQLIDARDLGAWLVRMTEEGASGTYNAVGPEAPYTLREVLDTVRRVTGSDAAFTWVSDDFLLEQGLTPWGELPFWQPAEEEGVFRVDNRRAVAAGLAFRPLADTVRDVAAARATHHPGERVSGIPREREAELLRAWHDRTP